MVAVVFISQVWTKSSSEETKMSPDIFVIIFGGRFGGRFWNIIGCMDVTHHKD